MQKRIHLNCGSHLEGRCSVKQGKKQCEGQYLIPITPEQRAEIKIRDLSMGVHKATCGHTIEVIGVK